METIETNYLAETLFLLIAIIALIGIIIVLFFLNTSLRSTCKELIKENEKLSDELENIRQEKIKNIIVNNPIKL